MMNTFFCGFYLHFPETADEPNLMPTLASAGLEDTTPVRMVCIVDLTAFVVSGVWGPRIGGLVLSS